MKVKKVEEASLKLELAIDEPFTVNWKERAVAGPAAPSQPAKKKREKSIVSIAKLNTQQTYCTSLYQVVIFYTVYVSQLKQQVLYTFTVLVSLCF
jgi:hypothetical protein